VTTDWFAWHEPYADSDSPLSKRLRIVQRHIDAWLDARPDPALSVLSLCAGQGRDLIGVLAQRPADAARISADLIEKDPRNSTVARASAPHQVRVHQADAGDWATYDGLPEADLLLVVGVLGNIPESEIIATIAALPAFCAPGATVIWTRTREAPDLTPAMRGWFADAGFDELAFDAPEGETYSVGVNRFTGTPIPRPRSGRLFTFTH
jgi:hypothetical protein